MPEAMLEDHRLLRSLSGELEHLLDDAESATPEIARARWTLGRHLLRHLAEEPAVLARLARQPSVARAVEQHSAGRAAKLRAEVERHLREWTAERILAFFPLFKVELRRLLRQLEDCMRFEEAVVYTAPPARVRA